MDHGQLSMVGHKFQWVFPEPLLHPVAKTFHRSVLRGNHAHPDRERTVWPRKGCIQKIGKIEAADGGTIFLDEIGELTPAA
jgi:hypothetical protein